MIVTDEELLRRPCEDVLLDEVEPLIAKLEEGLKYCESIGRPGIGLAAPQLGILKKIAIIRLPTNSGKSTDLDLVNCYIAEKDDKFIFKEEGCLSFPGLIVDTYRYREVVVKGNLIFPKGMILSGMLAIAAQHEIDHLNGVLLPDLDINK